MPAKASAFKSKKPAAPKGHARNPFLHPVPPRIKGKGRVTSLDKLEQGQKVVVHHTIGRLHAADDAPRPHLKTEGFWGGDFDKYTGVVKNEDGFQYIAKGLVEKVVAYDL